MKEALPGDPSSVGDADVVGAGETVVCRLDDGEEGDVSGTPGLASDDSVVGATGETGASTLASGDRIPVVVGATGEAGATWLASVPNTEGAATDGAATTVGAPTDGAPTGGEIGGGGIGAPTGATTGAAGDNEGADGVGAGGVGPSGPVRKLGARVGKSPESIGARI